MALWSHLRVQRLLRQDTVLDFEHARYTAHLRQAFNATAVYAILSNYANQDYQDYNRKAMLTAARAAFDTAWDIATDAYNLDLAGDSAAHIRFLTLRDDMQPYQGYDYRGYLYTTFMGMLVERMIDIVRRRT